MCIQCQRALGHEAKVAGNKWPVGRNLEQTRKIQNDHLFSFMLQLERYLDISWWWSSCRDVCLLLPWEGAIAGPIEDTFQIWSISSSIVVMPHTFYFLPQRL